MKFDELTGHYARLKDELETAYATSPWHDAHINRLADDLVSIERQLSNSRYANKALTEMSHQSQFQASPE